MKNVPVSAKAIANYFLNLAWKTKQDLTPMKMQKLVYFAHGWFLALFDTPLINEAIEAWKYGPVINSLYQEFKKFGNDPITELASELDISQNKIRLCYPQIENEKNLIDFLNRIWDIYSPFDGGQLSSITHQPETPWYITWEKKGQFESNAEIDPELIAEYFKRLKNAS